MKTTFLLARSFAALLFGIGVLSPLERPAVAAQFPWVCSFDGNDSVDIFWHYKGNSVQAPLNAIWLLDGINFVNGVYTAQSGDPNWSAAAVGRFHQVDSACLQDPNCADKNRDILWRHTSSALVAVWYMNGTTFQNAAVLAEDPGASWRIGGAADFNEDGYSDIVWDDNTTGTKVVWLMQGGNAQASQPPTRLQTITLDASGLTTWKILQAADFGSPGNGVPDGHADLLLYNVDVANGTGVGRMQIWYLQWNPAAQTIDILAKADVPQVVTDGDWKPLEAGNVDGDGKTDIIFRHATFGQTAVWYMDGINYLGAYGPMGADLFDTDWKMLGQGNAESTLRIDIVQPTERRQVAATAGTGMITLNWNNFTPPGTGEKFRVWRKLTTNLVWGNPVADNLQGTTWQDTSPQTGVRYDYKVALVSSTDAERETAFVSATVADPNTQTPLFSRGRAIVIVDQTLVTALTPSLQQLKRDLVADGWDVPNLDFADTTKFTVPRHVDYPDPPNNPGSMFYHDNNYQNVLNTKSKIGTWLQPGVPNVVLLIGHVPVPYSGYERSDGHSCCNSPPDHGGAWACDLVYATPNTAWPDAGSGSQSQCSEPPQSDYTNCFWEENSNHAAGDGKFDLDLAPGTAGTPFIEAGVGRIDFARMSRFAESETTLLTRYFDKIHRFRYNLAPYSSVPFQEKGVVIEIPKQGVSLGEWGRGWLGDGIKKMANLYGANSVVIGDPYRQNQSKAYAWGIPFALGCVECIYSESGSGVYSTTALATTSPEARIGFFILNGSYFADFDKSQDFMRASIATPDYGFSAIWRGAWSVDSMAVGEHLGAALGRTVDTWIFPGQSLDRGRYLAIMGDPTLRLYRVPAPNVTFDNSMGYVSLTWTADGSSTYYICGAGSQYGPWTQLTTTTSGSFTDNPQSYSFYMVRAVKRIGTASSGSYWESSQGIVMP